MAENLSLKGIKTSLDNHNHDAKYLGIGATAADSSKLNGATSSTSATANAVAVRDASGNLAGNVLGNAGTATKLATARSIATSGDVTGTATNFDGTANITVPLTLAATGVVAGSYTKVTVDAKGRVTNGGSLTVTDIPDLDWGKITTGKPTTIAGFGISDALSSADVVTVAAPNKILKLDGSGNLPASVTGNAGTATKLQTGRTISTSGDISATATAFDGTANITIPMTLANSGVVAGSYAKVTVDAKGRVAAGASLAATDIPNLDWSKITTGKPTTLAGYGITDAALSTHNHDGSYVKLGGSTMSGALILNGDPTTNLQAVTKQYVDGLVSGLLVKKSVRAATVGNVSLSGTQTVDGVALAVGDRVLVKNQSVVAQNGIYVVASGAWTRSVGADGNTEIVNSAFTFVEQGLNNADTGWVMVTDGNITLGTTPINWIQFSSAGVLYADETTITKTGNMFSLPSGVAVSGSYTKVTVDTYGRVTSGTALTANDVPSLDAAKTTSGVFNIARIPTGTTSATVSLGNHTHSLGSLSDTSIISPINGHVLRFNGTNWVNVALVAGDIPNLDWAKITSGKPTTLAGYGITDAASTGHVHANATTGVAGFMSPSDKSKLDSVTAGAQPNANGFSTVKVGATNIAAGSSTDTLELIAGTNISLTPDALKESVTIAVSGKVASATLADTATKLATTRTIGASGDVTGTATSFDGSANITIPMTLANTGVTANTYTKVTVDAKGRVTAGAAMIASDIPNLDWSKITSGKPTTLAGYGITDAVKVTGGVVNNIYTIDTGNTDFNINSPYGAYVNGEQIMTAAWYSPATMEGPGGYGSVQTPNTVADGSNTTAFGHSTSAFGDSALAEGRSTVAQGQQSHAEGMYTVAHGQQAHAEGLTTFAGYAEKIVSKNGKVVTLPAGHGFTVNSIVGALSEDGGEPNQTTSIISVSGNTITLRDDLFNLDDTTMHLIAYTDPAYRASQSHAEGFHTIAGGFTSHAEGNHSIATGDASHAEGYGTEATGYGSHAEGYGSTASGEAAHAEGYLTNATGKHSHAEGYMTTASKPYTHTEGYQTAASLDYAHAEGFKTIASGNASHAEGNTATASGVSSHAEGLGTKAQNTATHAEGQNTTASGFYSHAEGNGTTAGGESSHAEGYNTKAQNIYSHAEGDTTTASATAAHAEGSNTKASGAFSHAEGYNVTASGNSAHAEGFSTIASGDYSHAAGVQTQSKFAQVAIGRFNTVSTVSDTSFDGTKEAFIIGNGTSAAAKSNAFKVLFTGATYGSGAFNTTGADYAEFFEWADGNVKDEDRVGLFVTLDGEKIRLAKSGDDYILGIVSATASVIGDSYEEWRNKYVTDDWGRIQYHEVTVPARFELVHRDAVYTHEVIDAVYDEDGKLVSPSEVVEVVQTEAYDETVEVEPERTEVVPVINPNWDPELDYENREQRKEWAAIGMMGKLLVTDDGTCTVNGFCKPGSKGVATKSTEGYRVVARISENIVKVILK